MTARWPGWSQMTINIEQALEQSRKMDIPCRYFTYVWPEDQSMVTTIPWEVTDDGAIRLPNNEQTYEPIVEDGEITSFRNIEDPDFVLYPVKMSGIVVPEGNWPSPALLLRLPLQMLGWFREGDTLDALDVDPKPGPASVTFTLWTDKGFTQCVWSVTPESLSSALTSMRERHGEPISQTMVEPEEMPEMHRAGAYMHDRFGQHLDTFEPAEPPSPPTGMQRELATYALRETIESVTGLDLSEARRVVDEMSEFVKGWHVEHGE